MIEVGPVDDTIAEPLAAFFRRVWDPIATADSVLLARAASAAANPVAPGTAVPAFVFRRDGEVLGYLGTIPAEFWDGENQTAGYWLKGLWVLPEHRNGPVGFAVLKEAIRHTGLSGAMAVAAPALRLFGALGFTDYGAIPNFVSLIRPGRVAHTLDVRAMGIGGPSWLPRAANLAQRSGLAWLGGSLAGMGLRSYLALRGRASGLTIDAGGSLPDHREIDDLWIRVRTGIRAGAVRNGTFLRWRYLCGPSGAYESVTVRSKTGVLAGLAVVRRPKESGDERLKGLRVATLSDVLFVADDSAAGGAALVGAERAARSMDADALLCTTAHPAVARLLKQRVYVRFHPTIHLLIRDAVRQASLPPDLSSWWVTRGDGNSDEVF